MEIQGKKFFEKFVIHRFNFIDKASSGRGTGGKLDVAENLYFYG